MDVLRLLNSHPEFLPLYEEIAEFRKKPQEFIGMFSEALQIMDRNTTKYMIDELIKTNADLEKFKADLEKSNADLEKSNADLEKFNADLEKSCADLEKSNVEKDQTINMLKNRIKELEENK